MKMLKNYGLGLAFLAPSLTLVVFFFFLPAILTGIFSFTNMSTSTGISTGEYVLTPLLVKRLDQQDRLPSSVLDALSRQTFRIDAATLAAARAGGVDPHFVDEMAAQLGDRSFSGSSELLQALRGLRRAPKSPRALNEAAAFLTKSALNSRVERAEDFQALLTGVVPTLDKATLDLITERAYTGPVFTTENYVNLATQPNARRYALNTVIYVAASLTFFNVTLGLVLAILMFYLPTRPASVFSALWLLPRITPVVLYAVMWKWFTWDNGFLPTLAAHLGLPGFNYMKGSVLSAWVTMIVANGLGGASFGMIIFSGALRAIPVQQLWASEVDGANRWQQVWRIILPHMRWPILFVTSYQTLSLLSSYELIWLTTDGGPGKTTTVWALESFKTALASEYMNDLQYGLGAAMAMVLVVIGLGLSLIYLHVFRFDDLVAKPKIEL